MTTYIIRRILVSIPVLIAVSLATFILAHAAGGSYVPGLGLSPHLQPGEVARMRHNLGLDDPIIVQYARWLNGVLHGDFGRSLVDGSPVLDHIVARLPNTIELTITGLVLALLLAIPLGVLGALRRGSVLDHFSTLLSVSGISIPAFWFGLLLILVFSISFQARGLPWLPSEGATSPGGGDFLDRLAHLAMPATVLAFTYLAVWSRFVRSSMLEVLSQDFIRTARAKGMSERRVAFVHGLRNALIPLITIVGLELPSLIGGEAIIEIVFSWPGIGQLALQRALQFDYTVVLGITTFAAILVVVGNLLVDVMYGVLDPRIGYT